MTDNRNIASNILKSADKTVSTQRGTDHGDAENSFTMIADLWRVYLEHTNKQRYQNIVTVNIEPQDVAQMMSLLKKARFVYGKSANPDHFVDDTGYTALAGMMIGADPTPPMPDQSQRAMAGISSQPSKMPVAQNFADQMEKEIKG